MAPAEANRWLIVTGEYPPQMGGVSDYTRIIAEHLAAVGDEVHVFAPGSPETGSRGAAVRVHRHPQAFSLRGLRGLSKLAEQLAPCQILVQYVPQAFGWKGMNIPFCLWLWANRSSRLWLMFHEVHFPLRSGQPLRHRVLALVTRIMARIAARAAERIFVSTSSWIGPLIELGAVQDRIEWLPIPSTLPPLAEQLDKDDKAAAAAHGREIVGHFGTFGDLIAPLLEPTLVAVLKADEGRTALLVGRGAGAFADKITERHRDLLGRISAVENASAEVVACSLSRCRCLIQPYPDGISTRRTTAMSGLALGVPIVTNLGPLTEPIWEAAGAVAFARSSSAEEMIAATERLLADAAYRQSIASAGQQLYEQSFAVQHTVTRLQSAEKGDSFVNAHSLSAEASRKWN